QTERAENCSQLEERVDKLKKTYLRHKREFSGSTAKRAAAKVLGNIIKKAIVLAEEATKEEKQDYNDFVDEIIERLGLKENEEFEESKESFLNDENLNNFGRRMGILTSEAKKVIATEIMQTETDPDRLRVGGYWDQELAKILDQSTRDHLQNLRQNKLQELTGEGQEVAG
ncbi:14995_t:CDS:2, partial [Racocetra persica]